MSYSLFHIVHLTFLFLFIGVTCAALAAPNPENRKKVLKWSGIFGLVVLLSGFGLLGVLKTGFPGWVIVKLVCWLLVTVLAGMAFRKSDKTTMLAAAGSLVVLVAVAMVSLKPF